MQRVVIIYIKMQGYIFCKILSGWKGSRGNMKLSRQGKIIQKKGKKLSKSGLKVRLERFKNLKFSYPGEGDTPSPGPHPPQPRPCGPRRVSSALRASLTVAAATCPRKFQAPSHFLILRSPDIYIYIYICHCVCYPHC